MRARLGFAARERHAANGELKIDLRVAPGARLPARDIRPAVARKLCHRGKPDRSRKGGGPRRTPNPVEAFAMFRFTRLLTLAGACGLVALAVVLGAAPAAAGTPAPQTVPDLVRADRATLDALFAAGVANPVPPGFAPGRAIFSPGSRRTVAASRVAHLLWQGKVFRDDGTIVNKMFGVKAVNADWYLGESLRDGGPALIVDYSRSPKMFRNVRDEIREISPGLYLGLTYVKRDGVPELTNMFALDAPKAKHRR